MQDRFHDLFQAEFPIKQNRVYFNNASYAPTCSSAISAINSKMQDLATQGPDDERYQSFKQGANAGREELALLLNGTSADQFVFTESATQAINFIPSGFKFSRDDCVVVSGGPTEHPSNFLPWRYYSQKRGFSLKEMLVGDYGIPDSSVLDSLLKTMKEKTRLVVVSHVLYNFGSILPVAEIAKVVHENGSLLFLDVSQSAGNTVVNLQQLDCDFAAGTAAKWICGPLGLGFFYCKPGMEQHVEPATFGPNSCKEYSLADGSFTEAGMPWILQEGYRSWFLAYGLSAAIDLVNRITMNEIISHNKKLGDSLIENVTRRSGLRLVSPDIDKLRTSIVTLESTNSSPSEIVKRFYDSGVTVAEREIGGRKVVRISPHFYNDGNELQRLLSLL